MLHTWVIFTDESVPSQALLILLGVFSQLGPMSILTISSLESTQELAGCVPHKVRRLQPNLPIRTAPRPSWELSISTWEKGVCYLKMPLRKYGHHHVFPKCASHVAGILENYGQTWVSNSVGEKKNRGGACPPEKWGNETLVTDNSVALFLFLCSISDTLGGLQKENKIYKK